MMTVDGMYGFNNAVKGLMIDGFNLCVSVSGIDQMVMDCWNYALESEENGTDDRRLEVAAWALERAVTLKRQGVTHGN